MDDELAAGGGFGRYCRVCEIPLDDIDARGNVFTKAARKVVGDSDAVSSRKEAVDDM